MLPDAITTSPARVPYVCLATPCFTGKVDYKFCMSVAQGVALLRERGFAVNHLFHADLQFVEVARNLIVKRFLERHPDATDLFFIDDDVGFPPHKLIEFVERPEPVLAGVYPLKTPIGKPMCWPVSLFTEACVGEGDDKTDRRLMVQNGLIRAHQVPAGFLRIKRHVLERMADNAQIYGFEDNGSLVTVFEIFERGRVDGEFRGEDTWFCRKCVEMGIEIWVDPDIAFEHAGSMRWTGNFSEEVGRLLAGQSPVAKLYMAS